jgi:hypothetical protein
MLDFKLLPGKRWGIISQRSRAWGVMFQQYFRGSPRLLKREPGWRLSACSIHFFSAKMSAA